MNKKKFLDKHKIGSRRISLTTGSLAVLFCTAGFKMEGCDYCAVDNKHGKFIVEKKSGIFSLKSARCASKFSVTNANAQPRITSFNNSARSLTCDQLKSKEKETLFQNLCIITGTPPADIMSGDLPADTLVPIGEAESFTSHNGTNDKALQSPAADGMYFRIKGNKPGNELWVRLKRVGFPFTAAPASFIEIEPPPKSEHPNIGFQFPKMDPSHAFFLNETIENVESAHKGMQDVINLVNRTIEEYEKHKGHGKVLRNGEDVYAEGYEEIRGIDGFLKGLISNDVSKSISTLLQSQQNVQVWSKKHLTLPNHTHAEICSNDAELLTLLDISSKAKGMKKQLSKKSKGLQKRIESLEKTQLKLENLPQDAVDFADLMIQQNQDSIKLYASLAVLHISLTISQLEVFNDALMDAKRVYQIVHGACGIDISGDDPAIRESNKKKLKAVVGNIRNLVLGSIDSSARMFESSFNTLSEKDEDLFEAKKYALSRVEEWKKIISDSHDYQAIVSNYRIAIAAVTTVTMMLESKTGRDFTKKLFEEISHRAFVYYLLENLVLPVMSEKQELFREANSEVAELRSVQEEEIISHDELRVVNEAATHLTSLADNIEGKVAHLKQLVLSMNRGQGNQPESQVIHHTQEMVKTATALKEDVLSLQQTFSKAMQVTEAELDQSNQALRSEAGNTSSLVSVAARLKSLYEAQKDLAGKISIDFARCDDIFRRLTNKVLDTFGITGHHKKVGHDVPLAVSGNVPEIIDVLDHVSKDTKGVEPLMFEQHEQSKTRVDILAEASVTESPSMYYITIPRLQCQDEHARQFRYHDDPPSAKAFGAQTNENNDHHSWKYFDEKNNIKEYHAPYLHSLAHYVQIQIGGPKNLETLLDYIPTANEKLRTLLETAQQSPQNQGPENKEEFDGLIARSKVLEPVLKVDKSKSSDFVDFACDGMRRLHSDERTSTLIMHVPQHALVP